VISRLELETIVRQLFPSEQAAPLLLAISELANGWQEADLRHLHSSASECASCVDCWLEEQVIAGSEIRLFFRKKQLRALRSA